MNPSLFTPVIKPIETRYKNCRFRSRLEARWAVFFDALGLDWEYEKEGFVLPDQSTYLPDFWLPQVQMWAEVKAIHPTESEITKARLLTSGSGKATLFLIGVPDYCAYWGIPDYDPDSNCDYIIDTSYLHESRFFSSTGLGWHEDSGVFTPTPLGDNWQDCDIRHAITAARSARFEHGEQP